MFVAIALAFFVFTTVMAYNLYAESSIVYIFHFKGKNRGEKAVIWLYRLLMFSLVIVGAVFESDTVWKMGDIGVGLTAWVNVIVLIILCPEAVKLLKEYESSIRRKSKDL